MCLAWRGTEQTKWQDILTDLSLLPAAFDAERTGDAVQSDKLGKVMDKVKVRVCVCSIYTSYACVCVWYVCVCVYYISLCS